MNYEQKYNAVLEQAKKELATCGSMDCDAARQIFRFFPELAESEDERIRKHIVTFLLEADKMGDAPEEVTKWLAYLEKLKEQKSIVLDEDTQLGIDRAIQIVCSAKGKLYGYQSDDGIFECDHAIRVLKNILENGIEQKPTEWSEEDEKYRQYILANCMHYAKVTGYVDETHNEQLHEGAKIWLKSLCPKQKQEWSEDEEKMLVAISKALGCDTAEKILVNEGVTLMMAAGFLKSLHPDSYKNCNNGWKPSEEQMKVPKGVPPIESIQK